MPAGIVSSNRFQIRFDRAVHADTQAVHAPPNMEAEPCGDGNFTYVAIDDQGHPQVIKQDEPPISI